MKINKELFQENYYHGGLPDWECPRCKKGLLRAKEELTIIETEESKKDRKNPEWEPYWDRAVFFGKLICENSKCLEPIAIAGHAFADYFPLSEHDGDVDWSVEPKHFSYPLEVFDISEYPEQIRKILGSAFSLLWVDSSSCANKIRSVVEKVLNDKGVQKYPKKGKRIPLSLQKRIVIFRTKNADAAHYFEAIKWIGNTGSHGDDSKLKPKDLISAFEMLHEALNTIYIPHSKALKSLAKKIIKAKGPLTPKKIRLGIK